MIRRVIHPANFISHKLDTGMSEVITTSFYVKVGDLSKATTFFRDFFGMDVEPSNSNTCLATKSDEEIAIYFSEEPNPKQTKRVYLNVADCIEKYCFLKLKGVVFKKMPTYSSAGLVAEFTDSDGNDFVLLECRDYVD